MYVRETLGPWLFKVMVKDTHVFGSVSLSSRSSSSSISVSTLSPSSSRRSIFTYLLSANRLPPPVEPVPAMFAVPDADDEDDVAATGGEPKPNRSILHHTQTSQVAAVPVAGGRIAAAPC